MNFPIEVCQFQSVDYYFLQIIIFQIPGGRLENADRTQSEFFIFYFTVVRRSKKMFSHAPLGVEVPTPRIKLT